MRISDWSSDVCSSDLLGHADHLQHQNAVENRACLHHVDMSPKAAALLALAMFLVDSVMAQKSSMCISIGRPRIFSEPCSRASASVTARSGTSWVTITR